MRKNEYKNLEPVQSRDEYGKVGTYPAMPISHPSLNFPFFLGS